jgi:hypothetical protein
MERLKNAPFGDSEVKSLDRPLEQDNLKAEDQESETGQNIKKAILPSVEEDHKGYHR